MKKFRLRLILLLTIILLSFQVAYSGERPGLLFGSSTADSLCRNTAVETGILSHIKNIDYASIIKFNDDFEFEIFKEVYIAETDNTNKKSLLVIDEENQYKTYLLDMFSYSWLKGGTFYGNDEFVCLIIQNPEGKNTYVATKAYFDRIQTECQSFASRLKRAALQEGILIKNVNFDFSNSYGSFESFGISHEGDTIHVQLGSVIWDHDSELIDMISETDTSQCRTAIQFLSQNSHSIYSINLAGDYFSDSTGHNTSSMFEDYIANNKMAEDLKDYLDSQRMSDFLGTYMSETGSEEKYRQQRSFDQHKEEQFDFEVNTPDGLRIDYTVFNDIAQIGITLTAAAGGDDPPKLYSWHWLFNNAEYFLLSKHLEKNKENINYYSDYYHYTRYTQNTPVVIKFILDEANCVQYIYDYYRHWSPDISEELIRLAVFGDTDYWYPYLSILMLMLQSENCKDPLHFVIQY